jgi:hypothetical protein
MEARKLKRDIGKIETTRLERRLEKLINLHFFNTPEKPAQLPPIRERRASSIFDVDFSDLKKKSASELWKGVLQSQGQGGKGDTRGQFMLPTLSLSCQLLTCPFSCGTKDYTLARGCISLSMSSVFVSLYANVKNVHRF